MKKFLHFAMVLEAVVALGVSCSKKDITPDSAASPAKETTEKELVTITVGAPGDLDTKVTYAYDETAMKLATKWEEDDKIVVVSGEACSTFTATAISEDGKMATFTGTKPGEAPYTIFYAGKGTTAKTLEEVKVEDYSVQTQSGNDNTDHLHFAAILEGVDTYENIYFKSDWAADHHGTFKQSGAIRIRVQNPGVAGVKSVTLTAPEAIFYKNNGLQDKVSSITVNLTDAIIAEGAPIVVYAMLPWSDVLLPAGDYQVSFESGDDVWVKTKAIAANTLLSTSVNTFGLNKTGLDIQLFSGGSGTAADPYLIANARDFKHISTYCKKGCVAKGLAAKDFLGAIYQQTADIAFGTETRSGNISDFLIAGVVDGTATAFSGTYEGKYNDVQYTLSNFTVNTTPTQVDGEDVEGIALFKKVVDAKLLNISISNAIVMGGKFTAGLAGHASGSELNIEGCSISNSELSSSVKFGVGGLVGGIYGGAVTDCSAANLTIENSSADQSVYGGLISYIGGAVTVSSCTLGAGKIEFKGAEICGGIVGQSNNENASIINCVNNSTISSNKNYVGGIVGFLREGALNGCGNKGNITGTAGVGGLVGDMGENGTNSPKAYGVITNKCYNTGNITGTGNNVGGIAGVVTAGRIEQSRNTGNITSTGSNVGGIAAQVKVGDVNACYSGYNNTIKGASNVGGVVGLLYPITYKSNANRWLGGTKVINCQSSSYIISTDTANSGAAGCVVGWARQEKDHWGIVIANCTNWGAEGRVKSTITGNTNVNLGGIVGRLYGSNWAIVDNCFSYTTINAIQVNGANLASDTAANTAPFVNVGPIYGYMTGNYATIRDCFYRSGWNNSNYRGHDDRSTKTENIVMIKLSDDNVGKGTSTQAFNLYKAAKETYSAGTVTLLNALNRSAHNINDASTFKNYLTNVNTSNIAYEGWAQPTSGGWLVPAALVALGPGFYKN